jgi:hypothetical protein
MMSLAQWFLMSLPMFPASKRWLDQAVPDVPLMTQNCPRVPISCRVYNTLMLLSF